MGGKRFNQKIEEVVNPWRMPTPAAARTVADKRINKKAAEIGAGLGAPKVPGEGGLVVIGDNYLREYAHGMICYSTHAVEPLFVYGGIGARYTELAGPRSWLGWPTSDEGTFAQDGRVRTFEHGAIYCWPDTGPIDLGHVAVRYRGLYCFGETNEPSASDEPYVLLGTVPPPPAAPFSGRSQIYEGVDGGDSREDNIELYRGLPYGLALGVVLMEHDSGDPDKYRGVIEKGVVAAASAVTAGCAAVPYVGPLLAIGCGTLFAEYGPDIIKFVNEILGTGDDLLAQATWTITPKDMITSARRECQNLKGIEYHLESALLSDGECSYKAYFDVQYV